jgi:hypothetical protein
MPPNTSNGTKIIAKRRISHRRRLETGVVGIIPVTSGGCILTLFLVGKSGPEAPGDWKVARTRGQECPRYVRFFQNCSSRREEALIPMRNEPRYLGCYGVLQLAHVAQAFPPSRRAKAPLRRDGGQPAGFGDFPVPG